jgi:hypothetical protein
MAQQKDRTQVSHDVSVRSGPPPQGPDRPGAAGPRRRRRWPWVIGLVVLCLIVGLIALALVLPSVASSRFGTRYILSTVNGRVRGHLDVQSINLSWTGASNLQGVTLLDPQNRQVLHVNQVTVRKSLWHIVRSPMAFGEVDLDKPEAVVYLGADQSPSLAQAVESRQPAAAQPASSGQQAGPPPAPQGQLIIHGASIRVVKADGQELGVTQIDGHVTVDTLDSIQGQIGLKLSSGGQVQADAQIQNLVAGGQIDANQAVGKFAIRTQEPIDVAPLVSFADNPGLNGRVDLDVQGQLDHGAMQADLKSRVRDFYTQPSGQAQSKPQPIDLALAGQLVRSVKQDINGTLDLTGGAGTANARFAYAPSSQPAASENRQAAGPTTRPADLTGASLLALLLNGKPVVLPNVQANIESNVNLQSLAAAIPDLLKIQQGVEITQGHVRIANLEVRTQPNLAARGTVEVADLTATRDGKPIHWEPISLNLNAQVAPDQGLNVEKIQFQSGFAQANVHGNPSQLQGQFDADLAKLDQQLRQLVNLGSIEIGGSLAGRFTAARAGDEEVKIVSDIQATNLHYVSGQQNLDVRQVTFKPDASLLLQNQAPHRMVLHRLDANVEDQVQATADGWYDMKDGSWKTDVTLQQAQLPYLVAKARNMGIQAAEQYAGHSGTIQDVKFTADWDPQAGAITCNGGGTLARLAVNKKPAVDSIVMHWQAVAYSPATGQARVQSATVKADFADLDVANVDYRPGQNMVLSGKVNAGADLAKTLVAAYLLMGDKQAPPAVAGQLHLVSNMQTRGPVVSLDGDVTVDRFQAGSGEQAVRQQQVQLVYNTQIDNQQQTIDLRQAKIVSEPLTLNAAGTIRDFSSRQVLDLNGDYQARWEQVLAIVHEFAPSTAKTVDLRGTSASKFSVAGPAWQQNVQPAYRGLTAQGPDIAWEAGQVYGLELGKAVLTPRLADGKLDLPVTQIPASGGTLSIGAAVDLTGDTPRLHIPGQLQLMQNINLNSEIGQQLLSYVNPLFSQAAGLEGKVSMVLQDIDLPLGEAIKQSGSGRGQLNMENVRVKPAGLFGVLIQLAGSAGQGQGTQKGSSGPLAGLSQAGQLVHPGESAQPSSGEAVDIRIGNPTFVINNGKVTYDNFVLTFANGVEMVFSGYVGFDDTVSMYVGMPVTAGLMERAGVKGPVAQYASVLGNARIDVPLVGSRNDPKLDFAHIKIQPLVEQAIKNLAKQGIQQGIRTAVPGAQLLPLPGESQKGQGGSGILPKLPGLPGQPQSRPAEPQQQQAAQSQPVQQQQQTPSKEIGDTLKGIFGGGKKQ